MDPRLHATPPPDQVDAALGRWPELAGRRLVALLVTAFGDLFVEVDEGQVWLASPNHIACVPVASSRQELAQLFRDPEWVQRRLMIYVILRLESVGMTRPRDQVWAASPHPALGGDLEEGDYAPMDLDAWHELARGLVQGAL